MFQTNPAKAANKLSINSFMMGSTFFIFTLIWTLSPDKFNPLLIIQLVFSIPLLFVSSLAYSKIAYWKETRLWDFLGWITNNLANIFLLNIVGLMIAQYFKTISLWYFTTIIILMLVYSIVNVIYTPKALKQKIFKFLFLLVGLLLLGIFPVLQLY